MLHRTRQLDRERLFWDIRPNDIWPTRAERFVWDIWLNDIRPELAGGIRLGRSSWQIHHLSGYITHGKESWETE